jgi:hypothetical protein
MPTGNIVITGRVSSPFFTQFSLDPQDFGVGFGAFYIAGGLTLAGSTGGGSRDFDVPAKDGRPQTKTSGTDARQMAAITGALDNSDKDAGLNASFQEMANKGVTLKITVTETIPDWFQDPTFQVGGTRFPAMGDGPNGSGPDNFVAGSVVEIVRTTSVQSLALSGFRRVGARILL